MALARPAHLRVAVRLDRPGWQAELADAAADLERLQAAAELAVSSAEGSEGALDELAALIESHRLAVARVLVLEPQDAFTPVAPITTAASLRRVRTALERVVGGAPFAGGSDQFFSDVNRAPPPADGLDAVCFGLCPQVHAADDASLMENLAALPDCVETSRILRPGLPVAVSPVTLAARLGPYPAGERGPDEPPGAVDPRQHALFGASWTLGAIAWLSGVATESVTLYETAGWLGVVESDAGAPLPDAVVTRPGEPFPLLHVLADLGERVGDDAREVTCSAPLEIGSLAVDGPHGVVLLLANHTPEPRTVVVHGLQGPCDVRVLDETTAPQAMADPTAFRQSGSRTAPEDDVLRLTLGAYAVARVATAPAGGAS